MTTQRLVSAASIFALDGHVLSGCSLGGALDFRSLGRLLAALWALGCASEDTPALGGGGPPPPPRHRQDPRRVGLAGYEAAIVPGQGFLSAVLWVASAPSPLPVPGWRYFEEAVDLGEGEATALAALAAAAFEQRHGVTARSATGAPGGGWCLAYLCVCGLARP